MKTRSLQRWFWALEYMGLYLDRNTDVIAPDCRNTVDGKECGNASVVMKQDQPRIIKQYQQADFSYLKNVRKIIWYFMMNVLYIACSLFILTTRDYSDGSMTRIFFTAWYSAAPVMVVFSVVKCIFSQRIFTELFHVISLIHNAGNLHMPRRCKFTSNCFFLICLVATRTTDLYAVISKIIVSKNETLYEQLIYLAEKFAFTTFWALAFTLILSFNFFVGVLEGNFKQFSANLVGYENKLMETTLYSPHPITTISNASGMSSRSQSPSSSNLRGIEQQLLLIDQAIELITRVYSWNLIFLSSRFLTDLLFGIYLLLTPMKNGGSEISLHFIVITEALCFLFLMHNPADALSDAEEKFIVNLRRLISRLSDDQRLQPNTGIILALQRPRKLTLCNFGTIGRNSFLN
ncbi:Gustatory receptor 101, partial [Hyalella azteca]